MGLTVLVRSSPVPACLWDEVLLSAVAEASEVNAPSLDSQIRCALPDGDDSPENIAQDQLCHQRAICVVCKFPATLCPYRTIDTLAFRPNTSSPVDESLLTLRSATRLQLSTLLPGGSARCFPLLI